MDMWRRHLKRQLPPLEHAPDRGRGTVAQTCARPARQKRPIRPVLGKRWHVADGVDAGVVGDEAVSLDPVADRASGYTEGEQLVPSGVPPLPPRQGRDSLVN